MTVHSILRAYLDTIYMTLQVSYKMVAKTTCNWIRTKTAITFQKYPQIKAFFIKIKMRSETLLGSKVDKKSIFQRYLRGISNCKLTLNLVFWAVTPSLLILSLWFLPWIRSQKYDVMLVNRVRKKQSEMFG